MKFGPTHRNRLSRAGCYIAVLVGAAYAQTPADTSSLEGARSGAGEIKALLLRSDLEFITAEELHGRGAPSTGLDLTAKFLANGLLRAGLRPGGERETWFQTIPLDDTRIIPDETRIELGERVFKYGQDFVVKATVESTITGSVVYAGDGWFIKASGHDPYRGLDVKGKFAVVASAEPPSDLLRGKYGENWAKPADAARARGAKGIIYMSGMPRVGIADHQLAVAEEAGHVPFLEIRASRALLDALFDKENLTAAEILAGLPRSPRDAWRTGGRLLNGFAFSPGKALKIRVGARSAHPTTRNVIALLEGSDPALKGEYVAMGAHYDALPEDNGPGREPHPAADDNGSGTVALLAIAEAMAMAPKPKRSTLFIWHTGEEELGWGSRYFIEHPTVALNRIVAYLNLDMIGRAQNPGDPPQQPPRALTGPNEVEANGSANLVADAQKVNSSFLAMQITSRQHMGGSDYEAYRAKGVPVLWFTTGDHSEMHHAGDTADRIDYTKMERIAQTIYATARYLANTTGGYDKSGSRQ